MKTRKKAKFFPYGMMMPTIVIFGLFMIYPVVYSFYLSFMEFSGGTYTFVGLQNYVELFKDPVFYKALLPDYTGSGYDRPCASARCAHRAEVYPGTGIFQNGHIPPHYYIPGCLRAGV